MKKILTLLCCTILSLTAMAPAESPLLIHSMQQQEQIAPHALVIFGATGDLTKRKLMPALLQLFKQRELPDSFVCIAVGRRAITNEEFLKESSGFIAKEDLKDWELLSKKISYFHGSYEELSKKIEGFENRLFYLATPESGFSPIIKQLGDQGLFDSSGWSRLAIEKPFGHDSLSASQLQNEITQYISDEQIYPVDHYLAKNLVDELLAYRFSNPAIWNNQFIDHVSITISEDIGVGTRGSFWEQTGLLRDIVQNHIMQLVSLVAMETPEEGSFAKEKAKVVASIRPLVVEEVVRGQYGPGKSVPGYRQEPGVSPESNVETLIALKLYIDNERWQGVPFYIKAGKRLLKKEAKVVVTFKDPISLNKPTFSSPEAYQRLLWEAMLGDHHHFPSFEELKASWDLFDPVLKYWKENAPPDFPNYPAGSDVFKNDNTNSLKRELVFK